MKREDALKKSDDALQELAQALQNGKSESLLKYLDFCARFHRYSFGNCILIAFQKPDATHVAGFQRWKELGRFVKKGETGIGILAPLMMRGKKKDDKANEGEEPENRQARNLKGFKVVHIFDISQTEGQDVPQFDMTVEGDPGESLSRLEEIVQAKNIELAYSEHLSGAYGVSEGGKITILSNLSKAESFAVLAHELAHELLHRGDRRSQTTKSMREVEAEAVSYIVCRAVGIPSSTRSSDYIQLWNGDLKVLSQSLELIREVAAGIITELEAEVSQEVADVA